MGEDKGQESAPEAAEGVGVSGGGVGWGAQEEKQGETLVTKSSWGSWCTLRLRGKRRMLNSASGAAHLCVRMSVKLKVLRLGEPEAGGEGGGGEGGRGREGKGREGKGREGKGREGKGEDVSERHGRARFNGLEMENSKHRKGSLSAGQNGCRWATRHLYCRRSRQAGEREGSRSQHPRRQQQRPLALTLDLPWPPPVHAPQARLSVPLGEPRELELLQPRHLLGVLLREGLEVVALVREARHHHEAREVRGCCLVVVRHRRPLLLFPLLQEPLLPHTRIHRLSLPDAHLDLWLCPALRCGVISVGAQGEDVWPRSSNIRKCD